MRTSTGQFKLGQNWVMPQDNDPKHTSELTSWTEKKPRRRHSQDKVRTSSLLRCCGGISLWAVHTWTPSNINELKEERDTIPPKHCERLKNFTSCSPVLLNYRVYLFFPPRFWMLVRFRMTTHRNLLPFLVGTWDHSFVYRSWWGPDNLPDNSEKNKIK